MQKEEVKKDNTKLMIIGGVVVVVSAVGIYYLYSENVLISDYLKLVKDYEREYKEYGADGEIDEDEQAILENKRRAMEALEEEIKSKGFWINLIEALSVLGIIGIIYKVTPKVIDYIIKKWPPRPPHFICPKCDKDLKTDYRLRRHLEKEHPVVDPAPGADAWTLIQHLPQWILDWMVISTGQILLDNITKGWEDIPPAVQIILIGLALAALVLITAWSLGWLSWATAAPIAALLACV